ncbi:MAG: hypothetical protein GYB68_04270 [Chloroflexi bacterium]|nr:hypothetical protein [Chloroflexota bacterium]
MYLYPLHIDVKRPLLGGDPEIEIRDKMKQSLFYAQINLNTIFDKPTPLYQARGEKFPIVLLLPRKGDAFLEYKVERPDETPLGSFGAGGIINELKDLDKTGWVYGNIYGRKMGRLVVHRSLPQQSGFKPGLLLGTKTIQSRYEVQVKRKPTLRVAYQASTSNTEGAMGLLGYFKGNEEVQVVSSLVLLSAYQFVGAPVFG